MPTWFWLSPTSMAICRFGTASAARSTMRARCATRRDTCSPCALRSSSRLSSLVMRSAGTIRMALPPVSIPQFPRTQLLYCCVATCDSAHQRRAEGFDQRSLVLLQPAESGGLRLSHLDDLVDDALAGLSLAEAEHEARRQPVDPDQPLHPEDDR